VVTAQPELLDDVLGIAASVGVAVDVAVELSACRPLWTTAALVVVGDDLAPGLVAARLRPRPGTLVVRRGSSEEGSWSAAQVAAEDVLSLPGGETVLADRLADAVEPGAEARVVGVVPGRGGAGGSTVAATLALLAAAQRPAWLVDLDPLGGGVDAALGAELAPGVRWADLSTASGRVATSTLRASVPDVAGIACVSCDGRSTHDLPAPAVRAVLGAARRGGGTVVLDLPRHPTPARDEAVAITEEIYVVVPAEVRAVLAARQLVRSLRPTPAELRVLVRPVAGGPPADEVGRGLGVPVAGEVEDEAAVRAAVLAGTPQELRGTALAEVCRRLLEHDAPGWRAA
jgi:secretion/DNA translocation related CpaE-like protein